MAGLYGFSNYNNYSSLFSFGSSGTSGSVPSFYSNLGQYASVKSGAYMKALKSYYAKAGETKDTTSDSTQIKYPLTSQSAVSKTNKASVSLSAVKTEASELSASAKTLTAKGKDSLFADMDKYDKDEAYKAVSSFVSDYNDVVKALGSTTNSSVKEAGNSMGRMTNMMKNSLSSVGITAGSDGKLSIDEDTFKSASKDKVKALFNGGGSFADIISSSANRISQEAASQLSRQQGSLYTNKASAYNTFASGLAYEGLF